MRAIEISTFGDPEVLQLKEMDSPVARGRELLVRVEFSGVNHRDILQRTGRFGATTPFVPGTEGAGTAVGVGPDAAYFRVGDRVAWKLGSSYAEVVAVDERETVPLPAGIDFATAATVLLQGVTAHALVTSNPSVRPGQWVLILAAAGGVGGWITQLAKRQGAMVVAGVSTADKLDYVRSLGADATIVYGTTSPVASEQLADEVLGITGKHGVVVAFDGVGEPTFALSLGSLGSRATLVSFGAAGGNVSPVDPLALLHAGSASLTRPSVRDFTADRSEYLARTADLFQAIEQGEVQLPTVTRFGLDDVAAAHRLLESRQLQGKALVACR